MYLRVCTNAHRGATGVSSGMIALEDISEISITDSVFTEFASVHSSAAAVYAALSDAGPGHVRSRVVMERCSFTFNRVPQGSGGIWSNVDVLRVRNCTFEHNSGRAGASVRHVSRALPRVGDDEMVEVSGSDFLCNVGRATFAGGISLRTMRSSLVENCNFTLNFGCVVQTREGQ